MLDRKEKVTMAALIRKTGFSKTLFYRNIEVRTALDKAYREQGACYNPKQIIVDKVMEEKLNTLKIAVTKLKKENIKLTLQNEELFFHNFINNNLLRIPVQRQLHPPSS